MLFLSGKLSVSHVEISGADRIDQEELREKIRRQLDGNYFKYLSKKNLILINSNRLEDMLKSDYKLIRNVEIRKKFPATLRADMEERKIALSLCGSSGCFAVDESGTAFEKMTSEEADQKSVPILDDRHDDEIIEGESVMDEGNAEYISSIGEKVKKNLDIGLEKRYETPNRISGDIKVKTDEGWFIYFSQNIALEKEIEMLRLVLESRLDQGRSGLEYIDLRSENKVFYKYKEGVEEEMKSEEDNKENEKTEEKKDEKKKKKK